MAISGKRSVGIWAALTLTQLLMATATQAQPVSFFGALDFDAGGGPFPAAAVGDFNGDGRLDLAVTNSYPAPYGTVSVLLGNGDGTLEARRSFIAGDYPSSLAVGDFNGDGKLDLAVTVSFAVSVLLGNGDGTFQPARLVPMGLLPRSVAVGDFNGDGRLDLALTTYGEIGRQTGSLFLGNGDGTFQAERRFDAGDGARSLAVGDFNGDGRLDLAVTNFVIAYGPANVSVLLGNGDGTFQAVRSFDGVINPVSLAVGDFNGDGRLDLAVANDDTAIHQDNVSVLLGNGDGTFQPARRFGAGAHPISVAVRDLNGDGVLDLVVANFSSDDVSVLLGNGDGTFQDAQSFVVEGYARFAAVGDFDGDGFPDLAVGSVFVSVLLGNGDGTFQNTPGYFAGLQPASVAVGDFNGDGVLDMAVADVVDPRYGNNVSVLLGNGDGTFEPASSFSAGNYPNSIVVGDFDGDGLLDLAVANIGSFNVSVFLGQGDGTFQLTDVLDAGSGFGLPADLAVGDFNRDGALDVAVIVADYPILSTIKVFLGNGNGTFQAARSFALGDNASWMAVGDINGDGKLDLVANGDGAVLVLLGRGDGTFEPAIATTSDSGFVALADFNGDGKLDAAVLGPPGRSVSVLLGNGDGTFQAARSFATGELPIYLAVGDFDGDGLLDLVTANTGLNDVSVLLGNGDGTFQAPRFFGAHRRPLWVAVGDFNGDGMPDLAVPNFDSNDVSVLINHTGR